MTGTNANIEAKVERKLLDDGWNEITVSVACSNKVQPRQYEAAERNVYLTKKFRLAADATMEEEQRVLEQEIRRLNTMAEAESALIVAKFLRDQQTEEAYVKIWQKYAINWLDNCKLAFGMRVEKRVANKAALPAKATAGVHYVVMDTGEILIGKADGTYTDAAA